jgi:hypothetical protein
MAGVARDHSLRPVLLRRRSAHLQRPYVAFLSLEPFLFSPGTWHCRRPRHLRSLALPPPSFIPSRPRLALRDSHSLPRHQICTYPTQRFDWRTIQMNPDRTSPNPAPQRTAATPFSCCKRFNAQLAAMLFGVPQSARLQLRDPSQVLSRRFR